MQMAFLQLQHCITKAYWLLFDRVHLHQMIHLCVGLRLFNYFKVPQYNYFCYLIPQSHSQVDLAANFCVIKNFSVHAQILAAAHSNCHFILLHSGLFEAVRDRNTNRS